MKFIDLKSQQKLIRKKIDARIKKVLNHGQYINGPEVIELEDHLSNYVGSKHCISCSSGTDALLIPLMAECIGPGDAVITSPFTYIATAEVIALLGATPIFADVYPATFNLDPNNIKNAINFARNKGLNPRAIIPVDIFGLPARYRLIEKLAEENNLFVVQDAAQSFGSSIKDRKAGAFGKVSSTSFFPAKPYGCYGDGGAIFTEDDYLAEKMKSIRVHGSGNDKYENIRVGINGRLDTIQAAILLEKLMIFDGELNKRDKIANYYIENLNNKYRHQIVPKGYKSSWAQFSIITKSKKHRDDLISSLDEQNIPNMIYYRTPLHLQKVFSSLGYVSGQFPNSEMLSDKILSLPMHPYLIKDEQDKILEILNNG